MTVKTSAIEWTGKTWNPWQGCGKKNIKIDGKIVLREECRNCYMYRDKKRYGQQPAIVVRSKPPTFNKPLKVQKEFEDGLRPSKLDRLIFTCSWSDWFNPEADEWRGEAWEIIRQTPNLTYQILTKLPQRIGDCLPDFWDEIKNRIWLGYSCGMPGAEKEIEHLLEFDTPVKFLSIEPLLGFIDFGKYLGEDKINWVIVGGESGPNARPMFSDWLAYVLNQCWYEKFYTFPVFFKQWGEWLPECETPKEQQKGHHIELKTDGRLSENFYRIGVKKAGAIYQGMEFRQFPTKDIGKNIGHQ